MARTPRTFSAWAGAVILLILMIGIGLLVRREPAVSQPIAFNHLKHTQELGLDCVFCHTYVETGAHPGLPDADTCSLCHRAPLGESEEAAKLSQLIADGEPLRFNKLFRLPDHVFYTHRRHVGIAELDCTICHGEISETEIPPERPLVEISMSFCLDCHLEQEETVDCNACHR